MSNNIVDLRKTAGPTTIIIGDGQETLASKTQDAIEWSTYEYEKVERGPYWFLLPGGVALIFIIFGILARSYFFIAFVALAFTVLAIYMKREPRLLNFAITPEGIRIGKQIYDYSSLKSFWIFNKSNPKELSLETGKALVPYIKIPLGDLESDGVRSYLLNFIKEEEHKELISDQVVRSLGL